MKRFIGVAGIAAGLFLVGCSSPKGLYYWGGYQGQIYNMYFAPGEAPPERQLEMLEADVERARSKGKPLPPGYRAHMGYLYFQLGKFDLARQSFVAEKAAFPESEVLMDRFIKRLEGDDA